MHGQWANGLTVVPMLLDVVSAGVKRLRAGTAEEEGEAELSLVTILFHSHADGEKREKAGLGVTHGHANSSKWHT